MPGILGTGEQYRKMGMEGMQRAATLEQQQKMAYDAQKAQYKANIIGNTASGAVSGAAIGSVIPGVGTAVGAIVGGLLGGGLSSIF